jgi:hypothetical protein
VAITKKRTKKQVLKVHPNDPQFRTALDGCHALALRYMEAGGGAGGIGSAKALLRQQRWTPDSAVARLMDGLVQAAPEALRFDRGQKSVAAKFPEFRAWHALLEPLFGVTPPEWIEKKTSQGGLFKEFADEREKGYEEDDENDEESEE